METPFFLDGLGTRNVLQFVDLWQKGFRKTITQGCPFFYFVSTFFHMDLLLLTNPYPVAIEGIDHLAS